MKKFVSVGILSILVLTLTNGCMGFGMYENPQILEKGESKIGVGTPFFWVSSGGAGIFPLPELYYRRGVGHNSEFLVNFPFFLSSGGSFFLLESGKYRSALSDNGILSLQLGGAFSGEGSPVLWLGPGFFFRNKDKTKIWGAEYVVFTASLIDDYRTTTSFMRIYAGSKYKGKYAPLLGLQLIVPSTGNILAVLEMSMEFDLTNRKK